MSHIRVAIRVRPSPNLGHVWDIDSDQNCIQQVGGSNPFHFNRVFDPATNTYQIYQEMASEIVDKVMSGTNGTIFAYGSTGSGKTYTMMGEDDHPGVTPLAVDHIFKYIEDHPEREFVIGFSYFEIYNEKVRDLLKERSPADVRIKFSQQIAESGQHLLDTIIAAEANRSTGSTSMNEHSSRSHAIVRIAVDSYQKGGDEGVKFSSILNLVDLAGSECQKNTHAEGDRQHEASMINKSLLALSKLIDSLQNGKAIAVYRESKLTLYLQNSIGGNALTAIICTINGDHNQKSTSEYTLRFASKAMKIRNQPKVNRIVTDKCRIEELLKENMMLKQKILEYEENGVPQSSDPQFILISPKRVKPKDRKRRNSYSFGMSSSSFCLSEPEQNDESSSSDSSPVRLSKRILTRNTANVAKRMFAELKTAKASDAESESDESIDFSQATAPIDFVPSPIQLPKRIPRSLRQAEKDSDDDSEVDRQAESLSRAILSNTPISAFDIPKRAGAKRDEQERITALLSEIESLKEKMEEVVNEKEDIAARLSELENEYEQERNEWSEKTISLEKTLEEREALFEANTNHDYQMVQRLREQESIIAELKKDNQTLKNRLTRKEAEVKGSIFTQSIIKNKMEQKDQTIIQLGERIHAQRDELDAANSELEKRSSDVIILRRENATLTANVESYIEKYNAQLKLHDEMQRKFEQEIASLRKSTAIPLPVHYSTMQTMTATSNYDITLLSSSIEDLNDRIARQEKQLTAQSKVTVSSYAMEIAKLKQKKSLLAAADQSKLEVRTVKSRGLQNIDPNTIHNKLDVKAKDHPLILETFELAHAMSELDLPKRVILESEVSFLEKPELALSLVPAFADTFSIEPAKTSEPLHDDEVFVEEEEESCEDDEDEDESEQEPVQVIQSNHHIDRFLQTTNLMIQMVLWIYYIYMTYSQ